MPLREFTDEAGTRWTVWSTLPAWTGKVSTPQGWLTFESVRGRRRLVPIPPNWEDGSATQLRRLCERAEVVESADQRAERKADLRE